MAQIYTWTRNLFRPVFFGSAISCTVVHEHCVIQTSTNYDQDCKDFATVKWSAHKGLSLLIFNLKPQTNYKYISATDCNIFREQHTACCNAFGYPAITSCNRVAKQMQHAVPNNIVIHCFEM